MPTRLHDLNITQPIPEAYSPEWFQRIAQMTTLVAPLPYEEEEEPEDRDGVALCPDCDSTSWQARGTCFHYRYAFLSPDGLDWRDEPEHDGEGGEIEIVCNSCGYYAGGELFSYLYEEYVRNNR